MKDRQIEWLGQKKIKLESISMPSGFAGRKKMPHVQELARSIARLGGRPMNLPIVLQLSDKRVPITGRDRLAAAAVNEDATVLVELVKCGEVDAELMEIDENLQRRRGDDYDKLIARRVELTTEIVKEAEAAAPAAAVDPEVPAKKGRHTSAKGKAREIVAKATGKSPEAVRQAEKRHKAKVEGKPAKVDPPVEMAPIGEPLPPPVETYGLPLVTLEEATALVAVQEALGKADTFLRKAQGALLDGAADNSIAGIISSPIRAALHQLASDVRAAIPVAVCPYCKRLEAKVANCGACKRTGFVGAEAMLGLADELRLVGDKAMVAGSRGLVPYAPKERADKPPTGHRKLRIETSDGQPFPTE